MMLSLFGCQRPLVEWQVPRVQHLGQWGGQQPRNRWPGLWCHLRVESLSAVKSPFVDPLSPFQKQTSQSRSAEDGQSQSRASPSKAGVGGFMVAQPLALVHSCMPETATHLKHWNPIFNCACVAFFQPSHCHGIQAIYLHTHTHKYLKMTICWKNVIFTLNCPKLELNTFWEKIIEMSPLVLQTRDKYYVLAKTGNPEAGVMLLKLCWTEMRCWFLLPMAHCNVMIFTLWKYIVYKRMLAATSQDMCSSNPLNLSPLIHKQKIGESWITNLDELRKLEKFDKDKNFLRTLATVKQVCLSSMWWIWGALWGETLYYCPLESILNQLWFPKLSVSPLSETSLNCQKRGSFNRYGLYDSVL